MFLVNSSNPPSLSLLQEKCMKVVWQLHIAQSYLPTTHIPSHPVKRNRNWEIRGINYRLENINSWMLRFSYTWHIKFRQNLSSTGAELPSKLPCLGPFAHAAPGCRLLPVCPHLNFKAQVLSSPQKSLKVKLPTTSIFKFLFYLLVAWLKWLSVLFTYTLFLQLSYMVLEGKVKAMWSRYNGSIKQ